LRIVELPPGQDPAAVVHSGGREAYEALVAKAEPLDARLWRHEAGEVPLTTPEARAGLRQRLVDHASSIGDPALRRLYRDQWLQRFETEIAPQRRSGRSFSRGGQRRQGSFKAGRWTPPDPPVGDCARAIAASGIDAPTARALILGFTNFPEELQAHREALEQLSIADTGTARLRDELVEAAFSGAALDRNNLATILGTDGAAGGVAPRSMGFSFTRRDSDPDRARSDLAAAVEIIAATEEVEKALVYATERLKRDLTDEALEEQQRLIEAQQGLRQRLASLAGTD
jgi:DNA primase